MLVWLGFSISFHHHLLGRPSSQIIQTSADGKHNFGLWTHDLSVIWYLVVQTVSKLRYIAWIFLAALYHLPSFQSMGLDLRMNLSLFLTIYISSLLFLMVFHVIFLGLWYLGLVSRMAEKKPEMLTILQNCAVSFLMIMRHMSTFSYNLYFFFLCLSLLGIFCHIAGHKYSLLCVLQSLW